MTDISKHEILRTMYRVFREADRLLPASLESSEVTAALSEIVRDTEELVDRIAVYETLLRAHEIHNALSGVCWCSPVRVHPDAIDAARKGEGE
jgi:hypothetical protein